MKSGIYLFRYTDKVRKIPEHVAPFFQFVQFCSGLFHSGEFQHVETHLRAVEFLCIGLPELIAEENLVPWNNAVRGNEVLYRNDPYRIVVELYVTRLHLPVDG